MWDGFNKRKFPRIDLRCEVILRDRPQGRILQGRTENVGAGGICVMLEDLLERFSLVTLRLELDPHLPWVESLGKVVWIVPSQEVASGKKSYDTGIEFVNMDPGHQELIRSYVESRAGKKEAPQ
ncbi:MAG: PilZ domain-containing protein [Candidatus Omnitrophica bacterium]|nr:PilZ domain-containing protein [Candidatus Omnitrophota bacterium]